MASRRRCYERKQAILEEAGLSFVVNQESLSGTADGTNTTFQTSHYPITDANYDDEVDPTDLTVFVNGSPVRARTVTAESGVITLATAPAADSSVTCNYRYSPVTDEYLCRVREEAESWINDSMDAIDAVPYGSGVPAGNDTVPPTIRKLTRWYAAAQLLMRDYGFTSNTDETSKNAASKMKMAAAALEKYISIGGKSGLSDVSASETEVHSERPLFSKLDELNEGYVQGSADSQFMFDEGGEREDDLLGW